MPEFVSESANYLRSSKQLDILLGGANSAQRDAIMHHKGPMLVLAGPGSGKTFVITRRIQYLIQLAGVHPASILVITFTKAAALQMQERFIKSTKESVGIVTFGTFHSVFFSIIKKHTHYRNKDIITIKEQRDYVKQVLLHSSYDIKTDTEHIDAILNYISVRKNLGEEEAGKRADDLLPVKSIRDEIYEQYQSVMSENHKIDFDDMLVICLKLLEQERYRTYWQSIFQYILVDEFQDINLLQYRILGILASKHQNLFVVGDDDQAIYGFRGSDPKFMQKLLDDFPACRQVLLGINYRCARSIVESASRCIGHNNDRFIKKIKSGAKIDGSVSVHKAIDFDQECRFIREKIEECHKQEETIAVLFRTNAEARRYREAIFCRQQNTVYGSQLYDLHYIKDIMAVMRFVVNGHRREDFLQFMNKPMRYLSRDYIEEIVDFTHLKRRVEDKPVILENVARLERDCKRMEQMDPYQAIIYFVHAMKYKAYLQEKSNGNEGELANALQNIEKMQNNSLEHSSIKDFLQAIHAKEDKKNEKQDMNGIQITTYHGSKGLEFDHVFLPALNLGEVPKGKILSANEMEEERRMFYVAMTRAKKSLTLSYHSQISIFLQEIESPEQKRPGQN